MHLRKVFVYLLLALSSVVLYFSLALYIDIDIVDNRDYLEDGYDVYYQGDKVGYLYLKDTIAFERIN